MLRKEVNDLLTQTDKGTPMGEPFSTGASDAGRGTARKRLPTDPPRASRGKDDCLPRFRRAYGLIEKFCAHRRVSLWFGRNEDCGLRCPYHGWKFDVEGNCVDIPSEPEDSVVRQEAKLQAYPLIKVGDILWTHMGDPENRPPEPEWEFATVKPEQTVSTKRIQECNWLQALEGGIDSSHVSWLHSKELERDPLFKGAKANKFNMGDMKPVFEVRDSDGGLYVAARRKVEGDRNYWRITQWVMPCFTMIAPRSRSPPARPFLGTD